MEILFYVCFVIKEGGVTQYQADLKERIGDLWSSNKRLTKG